ncbi:hypothetical protein [Halioxenophilus aromaticivorans]|uniref:Uncharacterized protein n=1 Tax=Halioxenophilus aromaticivorans TaxID=1306992 RepID=A0AAV3TXP2_9ALTE
MSKILSHESWAGINGIVAIVAVIVTVVIGVITISQGKESHDGSGTGDTQGTALNEPTVATASALHGEQENDERRHEIADPTLYTVVVNRSGFEKKAGRSVMFGELFNLCGYSGFSVEEMTSKRFAMVSLQSQDQTIPGTPARGLSMAVPTGKLISIFGNCLVEFTVERGGASTQISIKEFQ